MKTETLIEEMGRQLHSHLLMQAGWVTTLDINSYLGFSRRDCKLARVAAGPSKVISTNKGYRATSLATDQELAESQVLFEAQEEAARLNVEGVLAVRLARIGAKVTAANEHAARMTAVSEALQRGESVDVWAAINGKVA
jgi:hypothetical protein